MSVVHGNKIQAHTRVRRAEIVQAAKPCAKRSLFYGERKKKRYAKEQETRKVTSYLHQDSAWFSSYHTANSKSLRCWHHQRRRVNRKTLR
ncbi:Uncharacterized protein DBV15_01094 [Temnothorax longispinosus]|uniref:Uncharacterized protein n=1 Tax=Temnothorax longispinosus TaxID=300112 RepID=A0A4V3S650_9HYME|nr:Uncharacterized protein DBV15_01094 [Temnothorax longispinosus]